MSGDIRTGIAGIGGAGYDIYTKFAPGSGPTPPVANNLLCEDGSDLLQEDGTTILLDP